MNHPGHDITSRPFASAVLFSPANPIRAGLPALALFGMGVSAFAAPPAAEPMGPVRSFDPMMLLIMMLLAKVGLVAGAMLLRRIRPQWTDSAADRLRARPMLMFFLGLLDLIVVVLLLKPLVAHRFMLLSMAVFVVPAIAIVCGMAGWYRLAGASEAVPSSSDRALLHGGLLVELATLIPFAGFIVQALLLISALGAGVLAMISRAGMPLEPLAAPVLPPDSPPPARPA